MRELGDFCEDLFREHPWDILILQELSSAHSLPKSLAAGHQVLATDSKAGQRALGFIVHSRVSHILRSNSFRSRGRAASIDIKWEGLPIKCICSHCYPDEWMTAYGDSINDVLDLADFRDRGTHLMIGIDAQDRLGCFDEDSLPELVGPFSEGPAGRRGVFARNMMAELGVAALNTFGQAEGEATFTCMYDCKAQARQIDFVMASTELVRRQRTCVKDFSARNSDHRAIVTTLFGNNEKQFVPINFGRVRKPIGWKVCDFSFPSRVLDLLGKDSYAQSWDAVPTKEDACSSFHIFTDGSCKQRR